MELPPVVTTDEWRAARAALLEKEKAAMRGMDALAAERRRLPRVEVTKDYAFEGPDGTVSLLDLFEGRRQLLLYRFFFDPDMEDYPESACPGCSMLADQLPELTHLHQRDTTFAVASAGELEVLHRYRSRMGWAFPWYRTTDDFSKDFDVPEDFGLNVFLRDGDRIFRTYFIGDRGVETLGTVWTLLDLTPLGRQEDWEDSPPGYPQTPAFTWWRLHDEY